MSGIISEKPFRIYKAVSRPHWLIQGLLLSHRSVRSPLVLRHRNGQATLLYKYVITLFGINSVT